MEYKKVLYGVYGTFKGSSSEQQEINFGEDIIHNGGKLIDAKRMELGVQVETIWEI